MRKRVTQMYNEKQKREYLNDSNTQQRNLSLESYLIGYFKLVEPYEKSYDKDLCNFTTLEILTFYKSLWSSSLEYLMVINSQFSNYTRYCMVHDYVTDHQNHFEELSKEDIYTCVNTTLLRSKIIDKDTLESQLNLYYNAVDKYVVYGLFQGMSPYDLVDLTLENINGNYLQLKDRTLYMEDRFIAWTKEAIDTYEYACYGKTNRSINLHPLDTSPVKVRITGEPVGSDGAKYQRISKKLAVLQKEFDLECLTTKNLKESGRIYNLNKMHQETGKPYNECLGSDEIINRYGTKVSIDRYMLKYGEWLKD